MTPTTRDGAANPIAIGPDDSLLDVFDRIRAAGQTPVELRIPNESPLFLTAAEFRTLRDVTDHGRHEVTIRTPDPHRLQLAKLFGLEVARTPGPVAPAPKPTAKPAPSPAAGTPPSPDAADLKVAGSPSAPAAASVAATAMAAGTSATPSGGANTPSTAPGGAPAAARTAGDAAAEAESSITEADAAARWPEAVTHAPVPNAPRRLLDRVSAAVATRRPIPAPADEPDDAPTDADETGSATDESQRDAIAPEAGINEDAVQLPDDEDDPAPTRRLTWPGDRQPSTLMLVGMALFGALLVITALTYLLPSATVRVELASLPINSGIIFDVTADGQPLDGEAAFALRGDPAEVTVSSSFTSLATGVQTIPDGLATGTIRFANPTPVEVTIEPGTIFSTESGAGFTLVEPVVVPAADPATLAPGEIDAGIEAVSPGTGGNVETGAIGGRLDSGVFYSNRQGATGGGTDREIPVVAQSDHDALIAQADAATIDLVTAQLARDGDAVIVPPSLTVVDQTDTFDQTVGTEAEGVTLEATRTVSILTYDQAEASRLIADELGGQLQATVPPGFSLGPVAIGADDVFPISGGADGGRFQVDAEARAALVLSPEKEAELASALAGKSPAEVAAILATWPEVAGYEIEPGFRLFTENLPTIGGRIEIDDGS